MAGLLYGITPVNDVLAAIQRWRYGAALREAPPLSAPLFILGHWRSGTTLLHELLSFDPRFSCPNTYQCFAPHHFLVSEWFFQRFGRWMLPARRPMDDMELGWARPQEDEFALMNLGLPSPYRMLAFPPHDRPSPDLQYLDGDQIQGAAREAWIMGLRQFLTAVSLHEPRRLVLKSPTHTGRLDLLSSAFAGAQFIHLTRDPRELLPSTKRLWEKLCLAQALDRRPWEHVEGYVLECGSRMYEAFHRQRDRATAAAPLMDVSFEQLVSSPVETVEQIYAQLQLGNFESVRPRLQQWAESAHREYRRNQHTLSTDDEVKLKQAWSAYFLRYGY
jgi:hypothetical protein